MPPLLSPLGSEMLSIVKPLCFPWDLLWTPRYIPGIRFSLLAWGLRWQVAALMPCADGVRNGLSAVLAQSPWCYVLCLLSLDLVFSPFFPLVIGLLLFFCMCSLPCFQPFRISLNFLLWYLFHFLFSRPTMDFSCLKYLISHFKEPLESKKLIFSLLFWIRAFYLIF